MKKRADISPLLYQATAAAPSKTDQRRARILEEVVRILATDGVDELTFESIGKGTGMARSHVVYYFKNRNELVIAAIRFAALSAGNIIESHLKEGKNWRDCLGRYIEGNFQWIKLYPDHATVYALLYYLASLKPSYRKLHTEIREAGTGRIEGIIETGPLHGKKKQVHVLAKAIQGLITGNLIDVMTTDQKNHFEDRRKETLQTVDAWLE